VCCRTHHEKTHHRTHKNHIKISINLSTSEIRSQKSPFFPKFLGHHPETSTIFFRNDRGTAIFGTSSNQAVATLLGPLLEIPVMLALVKAIGGSGAAVHEI